MKNAEFWQQVMAEGKVVPVPACGWIYLRGAVDLMMDELVFRVDFQPEVGDHKIASISKFAVAYRSPSDVREDVVREMIFRQIAPLIEDDSEAGWWKG